MLDGGCACGGVRYRLRTLPMFVNCCHCTDCQRQTGSAFAVNAVIETERVEILSGELQDAIMPTASGRPQIVWRCAACGTGLWNQYGGASALRFVRVGTLDEPARLAPQAHIYVRSRRPWVGLPEGVPAFEGYYDSRAVWPAESLERRRAAMRGTD